MEPLRIEIQYGPDKTVKIKSYIPLSTRVSNDSVTITPVGDVPTPSTVQPSIHATIEQDQLDDIPLPTMDTSNVITTVDMAIVDTAQDENHQDQSRTLPQGSSILVESDHNDDDDEIEVIQPTHPERSVLALDDSSAPSTRRIRIEGIEEIIKKFPSWTEKDVQDTFIHSRIKLRIYQLEPLRDVFVLPGKDCDFRLCRMSAYLIQSRGKVNPQPCTRCEHHRGPFAGYECISIYNHDLQLAEGACGSCTWSPKGNCCSYRDGYSSTKYRGKSIGAAMLAKPKTDQAKLEMGREIFSNQHNDDSGDREANLTT